MLAGVVRARVWAHERVALDLLGGAGLVFEHHEMRFAPCFTGCADTVDESLDRRAPALVFGSDVPLRAGPHFGIAGVVRYYALLRGDHSTEAARSVPWQYEWNTSARFSAGLSGRVLW